MFPLWKKKSRGFELIRVEVLRVEMSRTPRSEDAALCKRPESIISRGCAPSRSTLRDTDTAYGS